MLGIGVGVLFAIAVLVGIVANLLDGRPDRTTGRIDIRNDTARPVLISLCAHNDCRGARSSPTRLAADGGGGPTSVSSSGVPNVYLVDDTTGRRLGCLPLVMPHYVKGLVARISQARPCREGIDESVQWPPASTG